MLNPEEGEAEVEDIKEYHANDRVHFWVKMKTGVLGEVERREGIEKKFRL